MIVFSAHIARFLIENHSYSQKDYINIFNNLTIENFIEDFIFLSRLFGIWSRFENLVDVLHIGPLTRHVHDRAPISLRTSSFLAPLSYRCLLAWEYSLLQLSFNTVSAALRATVSAFSTYCLFRSTCNNQCCLFWSVAFHLSSMITRPLISRLPCEQFNSAKSLRLLSEQTFRPCEPPCTTFTVVCCIKHL